MGVGFNASLVLEVQSVDQQSTKLLGALTMPMKVAEELNANGGASLEVQWIDISSENPETLASAPMPTLTALKGSLG